MEGSDHQSGGGSRWNPTKEQINVLESLYRQGLRTPSAEQIQQITARLRDYGHIEGKNVFYWFQNHKARQRQKQKQETFAYYNRFLHSPAAVFPPYHNVVCSPCCIPPVPKNDPVYYQQHPKVPLPTAPGSFKRSKLIPETTNHSPTFTQRYNPKSSTDFISSAKYSGSPHQETLDLFPIHPTGILQSRNGADDHGNKNPRISGDDDGGGDGQPFFDFFCGN